MKRFILITLFLSFFGFSSASASWEDSINNLPRTVPFEEYGKTYTHIGMYADRLYDPPLIIVVYCTEDATFYVDGGIYYPYVNLTLGFNGLTGSCVSYISYDSGSTWGSPYYGFTYFADSQDYTVNNDINNLIRSNRDVHANSSRNWEGALGFYEVIANDLMVSGTVFGGFVDTKQLSITRSPELGGGVSDYPVENILCGIDGHNECSDSYPLNTEVTLDASPNEGYEFSHWEINALAMADVDGSIDVVMDEDKDVKAVFYLKADDFVFPVLAQGVTDPLLNNSLNPYGQGWSGNGVGDNVQGVGSGHLGQDYIKNYDDYNAAGDPVYAVANGTIVEVMNNQNTSYGWCDNEHHGWGPVVVIRHENRDGFNTSGSIITGSCDTETNPTVVYSLYGHLSKTSIQNLQIGQVVHMGDQIGVLGDYYATPSEQPWTTNHLHFELKDEVGYTEGTWYKTPANEGVCPESTNYTTCDSYLVEGVGTAYSLGSNFAPHRYEPGAFINLNKQ